MSIIDYLLNNTLRIKEKQPYLWFQIIFFNIREILFFDVCVSMVSMSDTDSTLPEAWEGGEGRIYTKDREMLLRVESSALQEYHVNGKNRMQGAWLCSSSPNPSASSLPSKNLAFRESAHYFCELVHFVDSKHSKENTSFFVFSKYSLGGTLCFSSFPTPDPLSFFFPFGPPITVIGLVRHTLSGF